MLIEGGYVSYAFHNEVVDGVEVGAIGKFNGDIVFVVLFLFIFVLVRWTGLGWGFFLVLLGGCGDDTLRCGGTLLYNCGTGVGVEPSLVCVVCGVFLAVGGTRIVL